MPILSRVTKVLSIVALISATVPVFAESAPVYDADSMPQQLEDSSMDQSQQDLPPGPDGAYGVVQPAPAAPAPSAAPISMSTDQRLRHIEQQVNNMQNSDAIARVDSLQSQVQALQGQVEELTHQLQQLQNQQKSQYSDLDKRLSQQNGMSSAPIANESSANTDSTLTSDQSTAPVLAKASRKALAKQGAKAPLGPATVVADNTSAVNKTTSPAPVATKSSDAQPNVAEEQQIYQTAYNLIKAKKYSEAVTALQDMLQKYPSGQFASNAHYWLGELYVLMSKNDQALSEFNTVVKTYPDSPRISDAQLKVGVIYASQSKWSEAKSAFKRVINHYPGTSSARLASEQLKQIKQAGH